jgi:hypothetical protein
MVISEYGPNIDISIFPAHETMMDSDGDDSDYVNRIVCLNADEEVCYPTAITDVPFGVLIEGAVTGGYVTVRTFGVVPIKMNAIVAVPNIIGITSDGGVIDGRAGTAVATCKVVGQILEHSDAEDDIVTCIINCINPGIKA